MSVGRWRQKLTKFRALSSADKWMLLHATVWLALARLALLVLPFRRLAARLCREMDKGDGSPDPRLLERIGYAIRTAAANVPWRSDCFPQSIAGRMLLKHYGYASTIHLGVEKVGDKDVAGHAWLTCGGTVITGGEGLDRYAEIHRLGA
jgi:hypothetical protein